jgi:hypothetical protein
MAITPNDTFISGQILTAAECNAFPFGVMALATSTTSYTMTTSDVIATGMTVTFTAVANRNYKITYYEPQVATAFGVASFVNASIKLTNAAGTQLQAGIFQSDSSQKNGSLTTIYSGTMTAGSVTIVGCLKVSSTNGSPAGNRSATAPAQILVEDIGTA